jgi:hypothetical protein
MRRIPTIPTLAAAAFLTGCSSFDYDLSRVPFPVNASPAPAAQGGDSFEIRAKNVMWCHGLFGESQPDVAALILEHCPNATSIADFRVRVGATGHDWLLTHLSLGLLRMKTVTITGTAIATVAR